MKIWILLFSASLFAGGTFLGVALQPKLAPHRPAAQKKDSDSAWGGPHRPPYFSPTRFASELELTDEQDHELDAILTDSQEEMQALGRAMHAAQDRSRERITAILTPVQRKRMDELMVAERQKRSDSELGRTVDTYRKILGLSDVQSAALRTVYKEARDHRRDGYRPGTDHQQARKMAREDQVKALEKVLTPDQFKRYLEVSELER